jgi:8-oxo-dGTP pyrophosphatase MutT (NUDIX family)
MYQKLVKYTKKYNMLQTAGSETSLTGIINKISYCAFSMLITLPNGTQKAVYVQKFPPAAGTTIPNMDKASTPNELKVDPVSKETLISFWQSPASKQVNGLWKGGAWGQNNLVTTDTTWLTGAFIGSVITVQPIANGIIKFNVGKPFAEGSAIIAGSEGKALSCHCELNGQIYSCYVTDQIMPQYANDVLFIYRSPSGDKIKLLKRGTGPNVDMPARMMPGAGEHMEPGSDVKMKSSVLRAVNEEIGLPQETLDQCYLLDLGNFNTPGRDPRYWHYAAIQDGATIEFGMDRGSTSHGFVLYFPGPSEKEPVEGNPLDSEEVNKKWWHPLDQVLAISDDKWMMDDHKRLIGAAQVAITSFETKSAEEKVALKMTNIV